MLDPNTISPVQKSLNLALSENILPIISKSKNSAFTCQVVVNSQQTG